MKQSKKDQTMNDANLNFCNDRFDEFCDGLESYIMSSFESVLYKELQLADQMKIGELWKVSLFRAVNTIEYLKELVRMEEPAALSDDVFFSTATSALTTYVLTQGWSPFDPAGMIHNVGLLIEEMKHVHAIKGHDYGDRVRPYQNLRVSEEIGVPAWKGTLIRLLDKVARLKTYAAQGELLVKDETIKDTCVDLANYLIIDLILLHEVTDAAQAFARPVKSQAHPVETGDFAEMFKGAIAEGEKFQAEIDQSEHLFTHLNVNGVVVPGECHGSIGLVQETPANTNAAPVCPDSNAEEIRQGENRGFVPNLPETSPR